MRSGPTRQWEPQAYASSMLALVVPCACGFKLTAVLQGPATQRFKGLLQRVTKRGDRILDANWCGRHYGPRYQTMSLEALKRVCERLVRDSVQSALDLVEAGRFWADHGKNHDRPFVRDLLQHGSNLRHVREDFRRALSRTGITGYI
jgi:hypothetical protein